MAAAAAIPGARGEYIEALNYLEQCYVSLAEAVPVDEYTWRLVEGVRSIGEVFPPRRLRELHLAGGARRSHAVHNATNAHFEESKYA